MICTRKYKPSYCLVFPASVVQEQFKYTRSEMSKNQQFSYQFNSVAGQRKFANFIFAFSEKSKYHLTKIF